MNTEPKIPKSEREEIAALERLEAWNNMCIKNANREKKQMLPKINLDTNSKVYVTGFSLETTCDMLETFFAKFGQVNDVYIPFNCEGISKGFGFIEFDSIKDQQTVLSQTNYEFNDQTIIVRPALNKRNGSRQAGLQAMPKNYRIYVGLLPKWITKSAIIHYFTRFGKVISVFQSNDNLIKPKINYCFVTFDAEDAVRKALDQEHHELLGKEIIVRPYLFRSEQKRLAAQKANVEVLPKLGMDSLQIVDKTKKPELPSKPSTYKRVAELMKNLVSREEATLVVGNWGSSFRCIRNYFKNENVGLTSEADKDLV